MYKSLANQREGDCRRRSNDQIIHKTTAFAGCFFLFSSLFSSVYLSLVRAVRLGFFLLDSQYTTSTYNVHEATWLQNTNEIVCMFLFFGLDRPTDNNNNKKNAENYFITVITSVRTYRNIRPTMSELQTKTKKKKRKPKTEKIMPK